MAFTRIAALLHSALSDVSTAQHHTATVAGDLNLADMAEKAHGSLTGLAATDHLAEAFVANMKNEDLVLEAIMPGKIRHSPGVAKVWVSWEQTGAHGIIGSYNYTSVTDGSAAGDTDHLYDDDFSDATYAIVGSASNSDGKANAVSATIATVLAGGVTTITTDMNNNNEDHESYIAIFGDQ